MNHNQGSSSENAKQCVSKGKDTFTHTHAPIRTLPQKKSR
jgi:hypothetical protein